MFYIRSTIIGDIPSNISGDIQITWHANRNFFERQKAFFRAGMPASGCTPSSRVKRACRGTAVGALEAAPDGVRASGNPAGSQSEAFRLPRRWPANMKRQAAETHGVSRQVGDRDRHPHGRRRRSLRSPAPSRADRDPREQGSRRAIEPGRSRIARIKCPETE